MRFFTKNKCQKFFTYSSKVLDVNALSSTIEKDEKTSFQFGIGQVSIEKKNVEAVERLKELDLLQFSICQDLENLKSSNPKKQELIEKIVETKLEMLRIAQSPDKYIPKKNTKKENMENADLQKMLIEGKVRNVLDYLLSSKKVSSVIIINLLSELNNLEKDLAIGQIRKSDVEYKNYISRIIDIIENI